MLASMLWICQSTVATTGAELLGSARSGFGEYLSKALDVKGQQYLDGGYGGKYRTEIIFPQGRSDERYYINLFRNQSGKGPNSKGTLSMMLEYETKRNGRISFEWALPLTHLSQHDIESFPRAIRSAGSMTKLLFYRGLKPAGRIPNQIRAKLQVKCGYASYFDNGRVFFALASWFNDQDGLAWDNRLDDFTEFPMVPSHRGSDTILHVRYPITTREQIACRMQRSPKPGGRPGSTHIASLAFDPIIGTWHGRIRFVRDEHQSANRQGENYYRSSLEKNERLSLNLKRDQSYVLVVKGDPKAPPIQVGKWQREANHISLVQNKPGVPSPILLFTIGRDSTSLSCFEDSDSPGMVISYVR